jgi:hypothetical protein
MLQIDHYQCTYGHTIWLEADSAPDLTRLHAIFLELARGAGDDIELCSAMEAQAVNLGELRLRLDPRRFRRLRLTRAPNYQRTLGPKPRPDSFVWSDTRSGWKRQAQVVDALLRKRAADCRDLTERAADDALIELSFRQTG